MCYQNRKDDQVIDELVCNMGDGFKTSHFAVKMPKIPYVNENITMNWRITVRKVTHGKFSNFGILK